MLSSLARRFRRRRLLKRGWRLMRNGDKSALAEMVVRLRATDLHKPLQAMLAKCLADDDEREAARGAFNELYASLRGAEDSQGRYLKIYALFHLALIRNSLADAAFMSRKAKALRPPRLIQALLPIPLLVIPPEPGPAITASL